MSNGGGEAQAEARVAALEAENTQLRAALILAGLSADAVQGQDPVVEAAPRLRTLADAIPQLVWRSAEGGRWIWASPNWSSYTGQTKTESHGRGWLDVIHPDDREATLQAWTEAPAQGQLEVEHRIRRASDGAWRLHQTRAALLRRTPVPERPERSVVEWVGASADVEDWTRVQGEQRALLLELRHRTRNLLAVVEVIARRSLPPVPERDDFGARLAAMGRVQGLLARSGAWTVPLHDLIEAELRASGKGRGEKAGMAGPSVELPGEVVQPLALVLHELAANAAKHGAIAQDAGRLNVNWRLEHIDGTTRLIIEWRERGVAMPPSPLLRRFGTRIIERTLPYQLGGEARLERGSDGIHCQLALPLPSKGKLTGWSQSVS